MEKPWISVDDQISLLKNRGLNFLDEQAARARLLQYGYYEIINGYKDHLLIKNNSTSDDDTYVEGATFEHIFSLFRFDYDIRNVLLVDMLDIELTLRTAISYTLGKVYTSDQEKYLNPCNFRKSISGKNDRDYLLKKVCAGVLNREDEPYRHYRDDICNIPPWILLKGFTFGNLAKMLSLMKKEDKNSVISLILSTNAALLAEETKMLLMEAIALFVAFRNRAGHCSRTFNYRPRRKGISSYHKFHNLIGITEKDFEEKGLGKNDLWTVWKLSELFLYTKSAPLLNTALPELLNKHLQLYPEDEIFLKEQIGFPNHEKNGN